MGIELLLKGYLNKKNWFGVSSMRFFELYSNGLLKFYMNMDKTVYKGSIQLGP